MRGMVIAAAAIALFGCGESATSTEADTANVAVGTTQGMKVANLELKDCDGKLVSLYALLEGKKAALLDFGAGWCKPCREYQPKLMEFHTKYASKGLAILGVLWQDDGTDPATNSFCKGWKAEYSIAFDVVTDPTNKYTGTFIDAGSTLPVILIVDGGGVIRYKEVGKAEGDLESILQDLLDL